ncbi:MAG TPA: TonB-dependent receptor plug domain-containing protein, partial [Gemmatimonadales bacterium]|nr:TonB-dependent receptor plug domain-containing protein [Gemmatimonadales bacterium]
MLRVRTLLLAVTIGLPAALLAQAPDTTELPLTTTHRLVAGQLDSLPVDSLRTALGFLPGVVPGSRGDLYIRGGSPDGLVNYLDGVPVQPGVRGGGLGTHVGALTPWATGLESAEITTGPYGAEFGNGVSGLLTLRTRSGPDHWTGGARYSTDELSGKAASFGVNRIEGSVGGPLGGKVRLFFGAYVHGQQSAASGLDGAAAPIFVPAGVDTTLAVPSAYGSPTADTSYVEVANWAVYRGDCSAFSHSPDPGVASNYGVACQGDRIPMSASTSARYQFRLDATLDARTELWFSAIGGRDQARIFDYNLIQDAQAMTGVVNESRVWTLGLRHSLTPTVRLEAALSLQHDQSQNGPLDPSEELNTRDPFGGFLIAPLKLRFNLSNFPVDDQLVTNYRENIFGSRRSPYDLNNTAQYRIIDQWRNDAYGLLGYADGGGPTGRLSLYQETRAVGRAAVTWRSANSGTFTFGVEGTHYDIANYSALLVSQVFSDVWLEHPVSAAVFATDRLVLGDVTIDAGLRYDHFRTGAARPWLLDTASTSPTFGMYAPFPRLSTYGRNSDGSIVTFGGKPLLDLRADAAHGALSPHLAIAG